MFFFSLKASFLFSCSASAAGMHVNRTEQMISGTRKRKGGAMEKDGETPH